MDNKNLTATALLFNLRFLVKQKLHNIQLISEIVFNFKARFCVLNVIFLNVVQIEIQKLISSIILLISLIIFLIKLFLNFPFQCGC